MASEAASLLDQLMGTHRNAVPEDNVKPLTYSSEEVCKFFLCGFCPSELFTNTKADIGPCSKIHDEKFKIEYEASGRKGDQGYEREFLHYLEGIIRELDRKIVRGKARLQRSASAKLASDAGTTSDRLSQLNTQIARALSELEELGASGRVEEARDLMVTLEQMERDRETERRSLNSGSIKTVAGYELDANDFHEKMEMCDVCGSFLVIGDTQSRVDAHLLGKQHIGYARIRSAIAELKAFQKQRVQQRDERRQRLSSPRRSRSKSPRKRRSRSPRRSRGQRSRSPRRSRNRGSHSPRRKHRSRSRSRRRRRSHRSRSRHQSNERSRKHSSSSVNYPKAKESTDSALSLKDKEGSSLAAGVKAELKTEQVQPSLNKTD